MTPNQSSSPVDSISLMCLETYCPCFSTPTASFILFIRVRFLEYKFGGAWVAQSVKQPTPTQVMILRFVGSRPALGCADRSEPGACFGFCVHLSLSPFPAHTVFFSLKNKQTLNKFKNILCLPVFLPLPRSYSLSKINIKNYIKYRFDHVLWWIFSVLWMKSKLLNMVHKAQHDLAHAYSLQPYQSLFSFKVWRMRVDMQAPDPDSVPLHICSTPSVG